MSPHLRLLAGGLFFWAALARADHNPARVFGLGVRSLSPQLAGDRASEERAEGPQLELRPLIVHRVFVAHNIGIMLASLFPGSLELRAKERFAELESALHIEAGAPASGRFGVEPFERKAFDFQRRCLNPCPLGGWGTCVLDTRAAQEECEAIAGRTLVSAAARRAPIVRDVLKLVGSQTTKLPTDVDRGLQLSAALIRGGGTLGIQARW